MVNTNTSGQPLSLREVMRWLLDESVVPSGGNGSASGASDATGILPVNVYGTPDHYTLRALLPGVLPDSIEITFADTTLTIRARIPPLSVPQGERLTWYHRELGGGSFSRTVQFPDPIDVEHIESAFANGVLTVTLPKAEEAKPKKIEIAGTATGHVGTSRGA